jgi:ABC-type multidrug transport system ATPase subunit
MSTSSLACALLGLAVGSCMVYTANAEVYGGCAASGAEGLLLPPFPYDADYGMCPRGYYCPNSDPNNRSTYPAICPPTQACLAKRSKFEYCDQQGVFEPIVCPEGQYCPTGHERFVCPQGYRCPFGTTKPIKCNALSYCPEGSYTELFLGAILIIVLVDALVVAFYFGVRWWLSSASHLDESCAVTGDAAVVAAQYIRKAMGTPRPVSISFDNLVVRLPDNHATAPGKVLLQGVSGQLCPGEVTAIMGPSGCGKTVLFTTILGKQPNDWNVEGKLSACGHSSLAGLRGMIGFVAQEDVLRADMTVHENIRYGSEIRLPAEWSPEDRLTIRSAVIRALGLEGCRDVLIGDELTRGVSGGQRKRCSVGVELASGPVAVFLDEPTTGLDASTALELVQLLKTIAREAQIPIAMVVHQPRVEIWDALDNLLLLAPGGRTAFSGRREDASAFLTEFAPEAKWDEGNPSDTAIDIITARGAELADAWERTQGHGGSGPVADPERAELPERRLASPFKQARMAHWRAVLGQLRTTRVVMLDILLGMVGAVLPTTAAINSPFRGQLQGPYVLMSPRTHVEHVSMLVMLWGIALACCLAPAGVRALGRVRSMYWRETAAGHSRVAYYIGASSAELYRVVLTILHFATVVYVMWRPNASFGELLGVLVLYGITADGQAIMLSAIISPTLAPLLAAVIAVFTSLLNGFPQIPAVSQFAYSFVLTERLYAEDMEDVEHVFRTEFVLFGYDIYRPGYDYGLVFGEMALFRLLALGFLVWMHRDKQR